MELVGDIIKLTKIEIEKVLPHNGISIGRSRTHRRLPIIGTLSEITHISLKYNVIFETPFNDLLEYWITYKTYANNVEYSYIPKHYKRNPIMKKLLPLRTYDLTPENITIPQLVDIILPEKAIFELKKYRETKQSNPIDSFVVQKLTFTNHFKNRNHYKLYGEILIKANTLEDKTINTKFTFSVIKEYEKILHVNIIDFHPFDYGKIFLPTTNYGVLKGLGLVEKYIKNEIEKNN